MQDPEIDAMASVAAALAGLEEDARARVLRWAAERYGITVARPNSNSGAGSAAGREMVTEEDIVSETPEFEHFAELFAAAQPKTNEDKALVAAYWVQVYQGHDQWQSRLLTTELKNLGHAIPNITDALTSNMKRKPQRVLQLKKSGASKQANKTYRVSHEGLVYVQGMLKGEAS